MAAWFNRSLNQKSIVLGLSIYSYFINFWEHDDLTMVALTTNLCGARPNYVYAALSIGTMYQFPLLILLLVLHCGTYYLELVVLQWKYSTTFSFNPPVQNSLYKKLYQRAGYTIIWHLAWPYAILAISASCLVPSFSKAAVWNIVQLWKVCC